MGGAENPVEWLGRNGIWSEGPYITAALDHAIEHLTIPCRKLVLHERPSLVQPTPALSRAMRSREFAERVSMSSSAAPLLRAKAG